MYRILHSLTLAATVCLVPGLLRGEDDKAPRKLVAKSVTETASLIRRPGPDKAWQIVKEKEPLFSGDLVVGGAGGAIESLNGAVRLTLLGDMNGLSPYPIVETAVHLHPAKDADFEVTLDRGRIDLTNVKKKGAARVILHVGKETGEFVLNQPGERVAVEVYGRYPRGAKFHKDDNPREEPFHAIVVLALKGEIELKAHGRQITLRAPPGPAQLVLDSLEDSPFSPRRLEKLPDWATDQPVTERGAKTKASVIKLRRLAVSKGIDAAVTEMLDSTDEYDRRLGVNLTTATDDVPRLGKALRETKYPDVWDFGAQALRHYIGRGAGMDLKLYNMLVQEAKYPPAEAEIFLNLLHRFNDAQLAIPATYETLLDYLESDRPAIRALAHWQLVQLVPEGAKIKFNPTGSKEELDKAGKEWRKLIPHGQVPKRTKPAGS